MGLSRNLERCWVIRTVTGHPPVAAADAHYDTEPAARSGLDDFLFGVDLQIVQLPSVCVVVICTDCRAVLGTDEHNCSHWTTPKDAQTAASRSGWASVGGQWLCPEHARCEDLPARPGPGQRVLL